MLTSQHISQSSFSTTGNVAAPPKHQLHLSLLLLPTGGLPQGLSVLPPGKSRTATLFELSNQRIITPCKPRNQPRQASMNPPLPSAGGSSEIPSQPTDFL